VHYFVQPQPETVQKNEADTTVEDEAQINDLKEFEQLRGELAKADALKTRDSSLGVYLDIAERRSKYEAVRAKIADSIKQKARKDFGLAEDAPFSEEQKAIVNEKIFGKLVVEENDAYLSAFRENKKETFKDMIVSAKNITQKEISSPYWDLMKPEYRS